MMGQSTPPRPHREPKPAAVIKPFGDIGIPALAAAAQFNARRAKEVKAAREETRDIPWMPRQEKLFD
ncbi:MAG: hypothetical protein ACRCXM_05120 [Beijerinckiaceae bacterium]